MELMHPSNAVCVVVPVLNEARYVAAAMDSLMRQDYQPLEIKVFDGGSTDGTLEILRRYPVEVNVVKNLGQMAAINRGWKESTAPFLMWFAADDLLLPGGISRLANELARRSEAGFVHADMDVLDAEGKRVSTIKTHDVTLADLVLEFGIMPQSTMIRRSALEVSGMMDERRRLAADWDLFLRLLQYSAGHHVEFTPAARRIHAGSEDVQDSRASADAIMDVMDSFFKRPDLTPSQTKLRKTAFASSRAAAALLYCNSRESRQSRKLFWEACRSDASVLWRSRPGRHLLPSLVARSIMGLEAFKSFQASARRVLSAK